MVDSTTPHQVRTGAELALATKPFAKDDAWRSWWAILSTALLLFIALAGTLWNFNLGAKIVCSVLSGLLLTRFFVIYHDQQHHAILSQSWLAEGVMWVFGVLSLSPSSVWRSSHNYHHKHNSKLRGSHIGSYPIMTKDEFKRSSRGRRLGYLFVRHPLTILSGYVFMFLQGMCLKPFTNHPGKHIDGLIALIVHVAIAAALVIYVGWPALVLMLLIPHFVMGAICAYFFYAQHNFPGVSYSDRNGWTYEKAALESSSFMHTGRVMGWFTANIAYHHIHHINHRIPFYRLPEVLRAIPELQSPRTTSLWPAEIVRCLRLKVWDVEAQRMIGLSGL
jgi:omega-6 fatty acid desaturase (delta-12 desaturase)